MRQEKGYNQHGSIHMRLQGGQLFKAFSNY